MGKSIFASKKYFSKMVFPLFFPSSLQKLTNPDYLCCKLNPLAFLPCLVDIDLLFFFVQANSLHINKKAQCL